MREEMKRAQRALFTVLVVCTTLSVLGVCAQGQTTSSSQLTIATTTTKESLDDEITSVVFTGPYALTLIEGQTLRPVFISREAGAVLNLGSTDILGESWTITGNSPSWIGTINVFSGDSLTIANGVANPLGAYSETNTSAYGTVGLYNGATLTLPARAADSLGEPQVGQVKIGRLTTVARNDTLYQDPAVVDVGLNQTLTVENGLSVNSSVALTKRGSGVLELLANGTESALPTSDSSDSSSSTTTSGEPTSFELGALNVAAGTLRIADGTSTVEKASLTASRLTVGSGATLDIQTPNKIELTGVAGDVVFSAADDSTINLYIDESGSTSYVATTFNTYMNIGATTLDVSSDVRTSLLPEKVLVFSTQDVGQTNYDASKITVNDSILGKNYVVDEELSTADSIYLSLVDDVKFKEQGLTTNERALGRYLDAVVVKDEYNTDEYALLSNLEDNIASINLSVLTGEIHASTVGFMYMNNLTTTQSLFDHLRNNALVAYSGSSSVDPMDYGGGRSTAGSTPAPGSYPLTGGYSGGAANGSFDQGPLYYNSDSNSYGPGVVPIMPQENSGAYYNGVYNGEIIEGDGSYQGQGMYNFGYNGPRQVSTLVAMRGQEASYGDPGTLIYSAWFDALFGSPESDPHKDRLSYNGKQFGFLTGLDLFGSCDCRFGAYYGYQRNELKNEPTLGKLTTQDHLIGLYHQFGDENVYNIGTIHGGYDRYKTRRDVTVLRQSDTLRGKYNGWNAGVTFERGANFAARPFVLTPYAQIDYNYMYREKFTESSVNNSGYALYVGKSDYHSLRGQVGGRIALDMYPGSQQIRLLVSAAYIHEFLNPMYGKTWAGFTALPSATGQFELFGNSLGRDWCALGVGLDWAPIPALLLFAKGNYLFNKYVNDPYANLGVKFRW
ncbi:MAG: autotransporter outer membrane beta-barrel domain-containing protein [Planctomycetia bacterium]|nr:autotransporter outer membrane beta-barrel domain-containing protein [Planctomycetia bacterium]